MIDALLYVLAGIGLLQVVWAILPIQVSFWVVDKLRPFIEGRQDDDNIKHNKHK